MAETEKYEAVEAHWGQRGVLERIDTALRDAGFDPENVTTEILAPLDQVHGGGMGMTKDQADLVGFSPGMKVLDIGCGIGGPARYLAETYGCHVRGVDLTEEWAAAGQKLTERCGLAEQVHIEQGNALDLPFDDQTFDVVWCQNVTMNIADKAKVLGEVHRVLKPGGKFSLAEYCQGGGGPIHFPVSWADSSEISFLVTPDEMTGLLEGAGFRIVKSHDPTQSLGDRPQPSPSPGGGDPQSGVGLHVVFGRSPQDLAERRRTVSRNIAEGRLVYQIIAAERP